MPAAGPEGQPDDGTLARVEAEASHSVLATLIRLLRRARGVSDRAELAFVLVNETSALVPFRQSALLDARGAVVALSGVAVPERNAPYVDWLRRLVQRPKVLEATPVAPVAHNLSAQPDLELAGWQEWLPADLLILPLPQQQGHLVLARSGAFSPAERALLLEWTDGWADAMAHLTRRHRGAPTRRLLRGLRGRAGWLALALLAVGAVPVPLTVLAPAELVPEDPAIIRAPLDGVVERILITPNQRVNEGDPLFEFDRQSLQSRLEVAERALATARAEYQQAAQAALFDSDAKARLEVLQAEADEKTVEVEFLTELNARGRVLSPRTGVVLIEDPNQWPGRPVVTGERVMVVADEHAVRLEAWLSPADAIPLAPGSPITFYPAANPLATIAGQLEMLAFEAELRPEGQYAYRARGALLNDAPPGSVVRVGMRGTAKLQGERAPLAYWVFRRPWASLRGWLGW